MPVLEKEQMGRKKAGQDSQSPQGTPEPTKKQLTTTKVDPEILRLANMIADYRRIKLFEWCHIEKHASYSEDGTVRTTFMLPLALRKAVRIEAMMIGRTMSDIIIRAMEAHPAFMQKVAEVEQFREMLRQRKAAQLEASIPLS
jgi:hypothetical protein